MMMLTLTLLFWSSSQALVPVWRLNEFSKRTQGYGVRLAAQEEKSPAEMLAEAARLRAEVEEASPAVAPPAVSSEEAKAKISTALKRATQLRDKEQLRIALSAAEESGLFSGKDDSVVKAVTAFNQLSELSDTMRTRLVAEARSQGGDPSVDWNPGYAYAGIFVVVSVLVILGGKGILY